MATNSYINKVVYGGKTLIDLSSDTVIAEKLASGITAHDKSGAILCLLSIYRAVTLL